MFRVIIAGGRDFDDYDLMKQSFILYKNNLRTLLKDELEIVSGAAKGADTLGERLAKELNLNLKVFKANWDTHGKRAGYIRNGEMGNYANGLLAFWNGESKGTKHMIDYATNKHLLVKVVRY